MKHIISEGFIDVKRFKIDHKLRIRCPKCNNPIIHDFGGDQYLSYPLVGKPMKVNIYCYNCGFEKQIDVTLEISLNYNITNIKL